MSETSHYYTHLFIKTP